MLYGRKGNLHVHTTRSDGTGTFAQLAEAARRAELDWLIITDHNTFALEEQGWRDGVLLLVGQELHEWDQSPLLEARSSGVSAERKQRNHLLVLGAHADLAVYAYDPALALQKAHAAGGLCVLAHPYEHSGAYAHEPEINWERWDLADQADGLELWNYMSEFKAHLSSALGALVAAVWPRLVMRGPYSETLARWDALLGERPCVGLGGSDAHAVEYSLGPLRRRVFPYEVLFRMLNVHALVEGEWSGDLAADEARLLTALRAGCCYIAYDGLCDGSGFEFALHSGTGQVLPMGATVHWPCDGALLASTPASARMELWHNGRLAAVHSGRELTWPVVEPGIYRIIARRRYALGWRAWIISNAIRVVAP